MVDTYRELQKRVINSLRADSGTGTVRATTVPIQSSYEADPAICLTSVVFIPLAISRDITSDIVEPLKEIEPEHHYYSPDSMHLTIKNVRKVHDPPLFTQADIENAHNLFLEEIPRHEPFAISLEEAVAFKTSVALIGYCDEKFRDLVQALDAGLECIGLPDDKRYVSDAVFFGNVTLCRYVRQPSERFWRAVQKMAHVYRGELLIEEIHLITCNAVCSPESRYIRHSYKLGGSRDVQICYEDLGPRPPFL
jgi:2'-5' RNA ligase